jgi:transposase-like protein
MRGKVAPESIIHSDGWKGYDELVDVGYDRHFRIDKTKHFAEKSVHINGIGAFWSFTKRRLAKFNGVKRNFEIHLKECEWRNNRELLQLLTSLNRLVAKNKTLMV